MNKGVVIGTVTLIYLLVMGGGCSRPEKKAEKIFFNTYETKKTLIITSDFKETEGWIEVQEKTVERTYGQIDRLYLVYKKDNLVGFVTADGKAYQCTYDILPYEREGQSSKIPVQKYIGTWKTLELNVQHILNLRYPVRIF